MKHFRSFTSVLILTGLQMIVENEALLENLLQRGGKSIFWAWSNQFSRTDSQRRRRFSSDETSSDTWWKQMQENRDQAADGASNHEALSAGEETYFSGTGQDYPLPFENPNGNLPVPPTEETEMKNTSEIEKEMSEIERNTKDNSEIERQLNSPSELPHHNLDTTLLRELIIEEHHRPSKIEFESVSQRLRDANENTLDEMKEMPGVGESNQTKEDVESSTIAEDVSYPRQSMVEYIIPGVEHVISHVEYVNNLDAYQELEEFRFKPTVEYVEPGVEFVEPEIGYLIPDKNITDTATTLSMEDASERERELEDEDFPFEEEYITIDQKRYLQVNDQKFTSSSKTSTKNHHTIRRTGSSTRQSRRIHKKNPELGIPEVDYPTLEILPVVHFPCEEYTAPGYYADVASRCQMFHVCHEDGQRTSFLCPVGTVFNQEYLVCDWWYNVNCDNSMKNERPESPIASGLDEKSLTAATSDLKNKIDAVRLGEITHSKGYNRISAFPHLRNKDMSLLKDKTNHREEKTNTKLENLSQKAMNYPMGYAILLRELMKNHETKESDAVSTIEHTNSKEIGGVETMDHPAQDGKVNLENRQEKSTWSAKQTNEFQRERKRHEYFGGSKPFTVSSGKKVYKNVRIKKIKLKYVTPNTRDITFAQNITNEPFAKTIRYEHWPERKLPKLELLTSRQKTLQSKNERSSVIDSENSPVINQQKQWIFAEPLVNPIQTSRNITEDFEIIYPFRQNYQRNSGRISMKNYNYNYNSAESNVQHTEKQFVPNNNSKSKDTSTRDSDGEASRESFSFADGKKIVLLTEKSIKEEGVHTTTKKPSTIPTYVKSATKKAYILEPEPFMIDNRNRKYGDRLSLRQFPLAVHPEKPTVHTALLIPEEINTTKQIVNATRERQSYTEESESRPVYLNNEGFRISDNGLRSILGMKINHTASVTQPSPVYLGTKRPDRTPKTFKSLSNETSRVPCSNKTESPEAAEFDYTSSFIKRISNLVSEIKAPGDSIRWNHTQSGNPLRKGKAYTISVRVEAKELVNGTNEHSRPKSVHSASSSTRHSKPWNISFLDGPVSPRTFNASHNRKKPFFMDAISKQDENRNNSRISNAHGGFVVKKVRLKREASTQPSFENRPALSNEKLKQYFRERLVNILRKILAVFR